jgi:hypothetical protein
MNKKDCDFLAEVLQDARYQNPNAEKFFGLTTIDRAVNEIADYIEQKLGRKAAHDFYKKCEL